MSSKGPKMVGGRYGQPGMAEKHQNQATQGGGRSRSRLRRPDPNASDGGCTGNFARKIASPCSSSLVGACARVVAGDASHDQNPFGLQMGQNDPVLCSRFWGVFFRDFELKMSVLGLGFSLARKTMFI